MKTKILVILLIMLLTIGNFLIVGQNIVIAVYEELEKQEIKIENTNVSFDVKYEDGTHSKQLNISEGGNLVINIKIEKAGLIEDGKIYLENNLNFRIIQEKLDRTYIKNIDFNNNVIELNTINAEETNIILPIEFEKDKEIEKEYFNKLNIFIFKCNYKISDIKQKELEKQIQINTSWTNEIEVNIEKEISKYLSLGENGILLEQDIVVNDINELPKEKEKIELEVPIIENQEPKDIQILNNGNKIDVKYENGKIIIENNKEKPSFSSSSDKYQIIYIYG